MESSTSKPSATSQQRVVMRKLQSLSKEHRNHLMSRYDFTGIAQRIDRYLSFERKQRAMVNNETQCQNIYNQLRRGYYEAEFNVFGGQHDPNMNQYGTDYSDLHGGDCLKKAQSTSRQDLLIVPLPKNSVNNTIKRISVSMYLQRNSALSQQRAHKDVGFCKLENMPKSRSYGVNVNVYSADVMRGRKRKFDNDDEEIYYDKRMGKCFRVFPPKHHDRIASWVATQVKYNTQIPPRDI